MNKSANDFNAIVEAVKESVATGDEGLLDAAIHDHSSLVAHLANSRQFSNLQSCLSAVGRAVKITDLINRKESLQPAIFSKVLSITHFHFNEIPSKRDVQTDYRRRNPDFPPNSGQSLVIAKAFILASKDDLSELLIGVSYFARMGHHQALSVLLEHYFSNAMHVTDETAVMFTQLAQLKVENTLQASITKVLKANSESFLDCVKHACRRMLSQHSRHGQYYTGVFTLPLVEAFYEAGFTDHAQFMAATFVNLIPVNGEGEVTCMAHRVRRLGADNNELIAKSRASLLAFYSASTSSAWMEDLLANPAIDAERMTSELSSFNFQGSRRGKGFEACVAVLDFAKANSEKFGLDYDMIVEKSASMCNIEIQKRNIQLDPDALKGILSEYLFPVEMILKVKPLKGAHLENELGL